MQLKDSRLEVVRIPAPPEAKTRPDRAPLVFLHEGLGSVAMWHTRDGFWPEQVCQVTGRAGVVFSRRGYGQSEDMADVRGTLPRIANNRLLYLAWTDADVHTNTATCAVTMTYVPYYFTLRGAGA